MAQVTSSHPRQDFSVKVLASSGNVAGSTVTARAIGR